MTKSLKTHIVKPKSSDPFSRAVPRGVSNPHKKYHKELTEIEEAREELGPRGAFDRRRQLDPLTKSLGQKFYISKPRLPWLSFQHRFGRTEPMTVDRYYPGLKLLIDESVRKPADHEDRVKLKAKLAESNGFFYFNIKNDNDLAVMYMKIPGVK